MVVPCKGPLGSNSKSLGGPLGKGSQEAAITSSSLANSTQQARGRTANNPPSQILREKMRKLLNIDLFLLVMHTCSCINNLGFLFMRRGCNGAQLQTGDRRASVNVSRVSFCHQTANGRRNRGWVFPLSNKLDSQSPSEGVSKCRRLRTFWARTKPLDRRTEGLHEGKHASQA